MNDVVNEVACLCQPCDRRAICPGFNLPHPKNAGIGSRLAKPCTGKAAIKMDGDIITLITHLTFVWAIFILTKDALFHMRPESVVFFYISYTCKCIHKDFVSVWVSFILLVLKIYLPEMDKISHF